MEYEKIRCPYPSCAEPQKGWTRQEKPVHSPFGIEMYLCHSCNELFVYNRNTWKNLTLREYYQ